MSLIGGLAALQLVVVLCLVMIVVSQDSASQDQDKDVFVPKLGVMKTIIVCQGKDRLLSCTNTSMVLVINKAWYGRKEKGKIICPYITGNSQKDKDDQTLNCDQDVKKKLKNICNKRKTCELSVNKEVFGRPCPGIYKYLEVIYACGLPVYVPKNVTVNVTKPNVTKSNDTQSNTTILPTTSTTSTRTIPLNSSVTTQYYNSEPVTSAVAFFPSSAVVETINHVKQQPSTNNSSSYIAVFVITAVCAAVVIGGVFARCWYLRRRTKSQKFAVLHKPKRFFEPPRQSKQSNGHATRRASRDVNMNVDGKTSDVAFTRADIESTPRHKKQGQGLGNNDEGDETKGDNSTFYVNPMYDRNRQGSSVSGANMPGSHPRTQGSHRLSNASDTKSGVLGSPARTLNKQQMRCNSMGNIPRSSQAGMQRRHPSAGNVASNKDMYQHAQQQSFLYNAPQIKGNYQGQGQGQGQQRTPMNPGSASPSRQGVGQHPNKNPTNHRPNGLQQGSPTKTTQRNRPPGGGTSYPSPGHQGRRGNKPNRAYEYGSTEKDPNYGGMNDPQRYPASYHGNPPGEAPQRGVNAYGDIGITVNPANPQSPMQYRNGSNATREERLPLDPAGHHNDHLEDMPGYELTKCNDKRSEADPPQPNGDTAGRLITFRTSVSKKMEQLQETLFSK